MKTAGLMTVEIDQKDVRGCRLLWPADSIPVQVRIGHHRLACRTITAQEYDVPVLRPGRLLAKRLGMHSGMRIGYSFNGGALRLGPVLGILTAGSSSRAVPGNRQMFRYVLGAARQAGILAYVFTPEAVNWTQRIVRGVEWRGGRWQPGHFPLPDVVYNRVPNRVLEQSSAVTAVKRQLRRLNTPYFNPRFLNKLDLYRFLAKTKASRFLPWTRLVRSSHDIETALKRFPIIYLKPKNSFAGKGILRVGRSAGAWSLRYRVDGVNRKLLYSDQVALCAALRKLMGRRTYMVQQGLKLARFKGRQFDARLLAQKNGKGEWQITGVGVRVAGRGSITTHVPNGGYIAPVREVLNAVFPGNQAEIYGRIEDVALTVAPLIEQGCRQSFGEMSMDIGIDSQGHTWFFEANAKPMKFDEGTIRTTGLSRIVDYTRYLAGFSGERG